MSEDVKKMFDAIASNYDKANNILSFGTHHKWKRKFIRMTEPKRGYKILDVATGTGDIAIGYANLLNNECEINAVDFSEVMIENAKRRDAPDCIRFSVGDATDLAFDDNTFDIVTITFGIRNIPEIDKAISEMTRVLKSGGKLAIMEFGTPDGFFSFFYRIYARYVMPRIGEFITNHNHAYTYLPDTALAFAYGDKFLEIMRRNKQLKDFRARKIYFGTVYVYIAVKSD